MGPDDPDDGEPDELQHALVHAAGVADSEPPTMEPATMRAPADVRRLLMRDRFNAKDFDAALRLARSILQTNPNDADASLFVTRCHTRLEALSEFASSSGGGIPRVVPEEAARARGSLNAETRSILALIDGRSDVDTVLSLSKIRRTEALALLFSLVEDGLVTLDRF